MQIHAKWTLLGTFLHCTVYTTWNLNLVTPKLWNQPRLNRGKARWIGSQKNFTYLLVDDINNRIDKRSRCMKLYFHSKYFLVIREVHLFKIQIQCKIYPYLLFDDRMNKLFLFLAYSIRHTSRDLNGRHITWLHKRERGGERVQTLCVAYGLSLLNYLCVCRLLLSKIYTQIIAFLLFIIFELYADFVCWRLCCDCLAWCHVFTMVRLFVQFDDFNFRQICCWGHQI